MYVVCVCAFVFEGLPVDRGNKSRPANLEYGYQ